MLFTSVYKNFWALRTPPKTKYQEVRTTFNCRNEHLYRTRLCSHSLIFNFYTVWKQKFWGVRRVHKHQKWLDLFYITIKIKHVWYSVNSENIHAHNFLHILEWTFSFNRSIKAYFSLFKSPNKQLELQRKAKNLITIFSHINNNNKLFCTG
jgi:hypothetical protein